MIPSGLLTQIGMLIVSVTIVFTYIKPAFGNISVKQDNIAAYKEEKKKVISVNSKLASLISQIESVDSDDEFKIVSYLPDKLDEISVQRDIRFMIDKIGLIYRNLSISDKENDPNTSTQDNNTSRNSDKPKVHTISLEVAGDYQQLKEFLVLLESNAYPLELTSLKVNPSKSGIDLDIFMDLTTYTYNEIALPEDNANETNETG